MSRAAEDLAREGSAEMVMVTLTSNFKAVVQGPDWHGSARTHIGRAALWEVFDHRGRLVTHRGHGISEVAFLLARHYRGDVEVVVYVNGRLAADTRWPIYAHLKGAKR